MRVAAGLLVWAAVAVAPPAAWAVSDLAGRQSEAERQQAALRDRIDALQKEIDTREAARKEAADALKESESAISRINLRLRELGEASRKAEAELAGLEKQVVAQQAVLQSAAPSWPTSCAPSTPAACRPGRPCCRATTRSSWAATWATWTMYRAPARRRCMRCARISPGSRRCRGRPMPAATTSRRWWPRRPARRPRWSNSRKPAPPCWRN